MIGARLYKFVAAPLALFCMCAIFAGGFAYVLYGLWIGVAGTYQHGIDCVLKGIELLFLAPLVYLVFSTTVTLVISVRKRLKALNQGLDGAVLNSSRLNLEETFHVVHRVKQSVAGLFVALLLTDLVGRILNRERLTWLELTAQLAALVMGLLYYLVQVQPPSDHRDSD